MPVCTCTHRCIPLAEVYIRPGTHTHVRACANSTRPPTRACIDRTHHPRIHTCAYTCMLRAMATRPVSHVNYTLCIIYREMASIRQETSETGLSDRFACRPQPRSPTSGNRAPLL